MRVHHKTWREVFERDRAICRYCGENLLESFSRYWSATVDHVQSVAAKGTDDAANLVVACFGCNSMLSRSGHLTTVETRREFVQKRIAAERDGFENWKVKVRPSTPIPPALTPSSETPAQPPLTKDT